MGDYIRYAKLFCPMTTYLKLVIDSLIKTKYNWKEFLEQIWASRSRVWTENAQKNDKLFAT